MTDAEIAARLAAARNGVDRPGPISIDIHPVNFARPCAVSAPAMLRTPDGGMIKGTQVICFGGSDVRLDYAMDMASKLYRHPASIDSMEEAAKMSFELVDAVIAEFKRRSQAESGADAE